jgi:hypothetical protein
MRAAYLRTAVLALSAVLGSSCGNGGYNAENVTIAASPATVTVPENGESPLQATVKGFCSGCMPNIVWSLSENNGTPCSWLDMNTRPVGPCPAGTIQGQEAIGPLSPNVIYFASGTFHLSASQFVDLTETKVGTAVITVSP